MPGSTAKILDGTKLAQEIKSDLAQKIAKTEKRPGLAAILIGDDPASKIYINLKEKACQEVGINFHKYLCNEDCYSGISEKELLGLIKFLNKDGAIDGIIVQLPLPPKYNTSKIIKSINPAKDVDGFHPKNKNKKIIPPTIGAIIELLKATGEDLADKKTLIIGHGDIFTSGIKKYLTERFGIKKISTSKTVPKNSDGYDIVIIALGRPGILKKDMVKTGSIIIDVGISRKSGRTVGDVDPRVAEKAGWLSPVPGGVGPLTVVCLLKNTFILS
jgi:methylenetetrahydrofolate dehydrogenase (NADP+) / methenyltetrahydrofolate cyclohydrolase